MAQAAVNVERRRDERGRLTTPGILLGLGLGGFVDGIVLHQIFQWHHMLTSTGDHPATTVKGLETNTLADGLFHGATLFLAIAGLFVLWGIIHRGDVRDYGRSLFGWILAGWGIFNLVEGVVDHHILEIHHVKPGPNEALFDIGFLVLGALLLAVGVAMSRLGRHQPLRQKARGFRSQQLLAVPARGRARYRSHSADSLRTHKGCKWQTPCGTPR